MDRRNFLVASGAAVLGGSALACNNSSKEITYPNRGFNCTEVVILQKMEGRYSLRVWEGYPETAFLFDYERMQIVPIPTQNLQFDPTKGIGIHYSFNDDTAKFIFANGSFTIKDLSTDTTTLRFEDGKYYVENFA